MSTKEPGNSKGTLCKNVFVLIESKTVIRIHHGVYEIYKPLGLATAFSQVDICDQILETDQVVTWNTLRNTNFKYSAA